MLSRPTRLRELAAILVIALLAGGTVYGGYRLIARQIVRSRVRAAIPLLQAQIRSQREVLIRAIQAYHADFGVYPPDNVVSRNPLVVDPANNPLVYELSGTRYDPENQTYMPGPFRAADATFLRTYFHCAGFTNRADAGVQPKDYLFAKQPVSAIHREPTVYVLACAIEPHIADCYYEVLVSPWMYVSSCSTNNPGRFDLWVKISALGKNYIVGNWAEAQ